MHRTTSGNKCLMFLFSSADATNFYYLVEIKVLLILKILKRNSFCDIKHISSLSSRPRHLQEIKLLNSEPTFLKIKKCGARILKLLGYR